MRYLGFVAALFSLACAGLAPRPAWTPRVFPISFWCGPPDKYLTEDRFREIADAGFNIVMPPCEGAATVERNRTILGLCAKVGLKAFIQDSRMPASLQDGAKARTALDAIIADYSRYPALAGYFLTDEPGAGAFGGLAQVVAYVKEHDPAHQVFINLLPNYASPEQLGTLTYEEHLDRYLTTVHPFVLSYDHYHFLTSGDRPGFFRNLSQARDAALAHGVPFWQIVLAISHGPYRELTEAEKRYEAMQTLAFGGKGVLFFTYWTPPSDPTWQWKPAIISYTGERSRQYDQVTRVNHDVAELGKWLLDAQSIAVFLNGSPAPEIMPRPDGAPVQFPGGGDVTAGLFKRDSHLYALFANRDYNKRTTCQADLGTAGKPVQKLDLATGKWLVVTGAKSPLGDLRVSLDLAPAEGALYRW